MNPKTPQQILIEVGADISLSLDTGMMLTSEDLSLLRADRTDCTDLDFEDEYYASPS